MGTIKRNFYNNITPTGKFDSADLTGTIPADNIANASLTNVTSVPASVGDLVQKVASDPTPVGAGDVWYNTTSNALKSVVSSAAWSSGAPLSIASRTSGFGASQDAAGAVVGPNMDTEEYNGTGWTTSNPASSAQSSYVGGSTSGTQTAAYIVGGRRISPEADFGNSSNYDGSTWTSSGAISPGRIGAGAVGTQTAGLAAAGGQSGVAGVLSSSASYDGSTWTATSPLNTAVNQRDGVHGGTQTSAIQAGGERSPDVNPYNLHEHFDGTSWSDQSTMIAGKRYAGANGTQSSYIIYGGFQSPSASGDGDGSVTNNTQTWDGTSWSTGQSMTTSAWSRGAISNTSDNQSALAIGGSTPTAVGTTEEYNVSTNVITGAAWASGANYPISRGQVGGAGTQTAALAFGGYLNTNPDPTQYTNVTNEYDGSAWTAGGNLVNASGHTINGVGLQTAALTFNPNQGPPYQYDKFESYDGSSWTSLTNRPGDRYSGASAGLQTAAMEFGGRSSPSVKLFTSTNEWDGASWTSGGTMNTGRDNNAGAGTLTAGIGGGGYTATSSPGSTDVEEYNGTTWTSAPSSNTLKRQYRMNGSQTATMIQAGLAPHIAPGAQGVTESYDGSAWATSPSMAVSRSWFASGSSSPSSAGWGSAGYSNPSYSTTATEEFTGETVAANIVEITTS